MRHQAGYKPFLWEIELHTQWRCTWVKSWIQIPRILVSDNSCNFLSGDLKQWCESLGIKRMELPIYHARDNWLAKRAIQTVKMATQAWIQNLVLSFSAFSHRPWWHTGINPRRGSGLCGTTARTKKDTSSSHWLWSVWTSPLQTNKHTTNSSSYFTQRNEHFFHPARNFEQDGAL